MGSDHRQTLNVPAPTVSGPHFHGVHGHLPKVHLGAHVSESRTAGSNANNADGDDEKEHRQGQVRSNFVRRIQASSSIITSATLLTLLREEDAWVTARDNSSAYIYPLLTSIVIGTLVLVAFKASQMTEVPSLQ